MTFFKLAKASNTKQEHHPQTMRFIPLKVIFDFHINLLIFKCHNCDLAISI